jgi:hypothetical protein
MKKAADQMGQCPICKKPILVKSLKRHLKTHDNGKFFKKFINFFSGNFYVRPPPTIPWTTYDFLLQISKKRVIKSSLIIKNTYFMYCAAFHSISQCLRNRYGNFERLNQPVDDRLMVWWALTRTRTSNYLSGSTTGLKLGSVDEVLSIALCPELGASNLMMAELL